MTDTTRTVREQAFLPLECDIPAEMTIAGYRSDRARRETEVEPPRPRRRRMPRVRRH